jgi:hypothetical protein
MDAEVKSDGKEIVARLQGLRGAEVVPTKEELVAIALGSLEHFTQDFDGKQQTAILARMRKWMVNLPEDDPAMKELATRFYTQLHDYRKRWAGRDIGRDGKMTNWYYPKK